MATKEDVLEQVAEEYLLHQGYFVQHNVKYRPRSDHPEHDHNKDSVNSDIDVVGLHPGLQGAKRVMVVSCKSWQGGFKPSTVLEKIESGGKVSGREAWIGYRELCIPKWSDAFCRKIREITGSDEFTYVLAVTVVKGDKSVWENHKRFRDAINGNPIAVLTFREMVRQIQSDLTTTPAATEIGRLLQLSKAAGIDFGKDV